MTETEIEAGFQRSIAQAKEMIDAPQVIYRSPTQAAVFGWAKGLPHVIANYRCTLISRLPRPPFAGVRA